MEAGGFVRPRVQLKVNHLARGFALPLEEVLSDLLNGLKSYRIVKISYEGHNCTNYLPN